MKRDPDEFRVRFAGPEKVTVQSGSGLLFSVFGARSTLFVVCQFDIKQRQQFLAHRKQKTVGKGVVSHSLPVVARGLIPSIYRRADFPHRAAPQSGSPCGETWLVTEWSRERGGIERSSGWVVASHSEIGSRLAADAES